MSKVSKQQAPSAAASSAAFASSSIKKSPEVQLREFEEAFAFFDRDEDGYLRTEQLGIAMRSLGAAPTLDEVTAYVREVDGMRQSGKISLGEFIDVMTRELQKADRDEEIIGAFSYLDKNGSGFVPVAELKRVMMALGDKLTEEEVEEMLEEAGIEKEYISFDDYLRMASSDRS